MKQKKLHQYLLQEKSLFSDPSEIFMISTISQNKTQVTK